jgi:hypothetical protein
MTFTIPGLRSTIATSAIAILSLGAAPAAYATAVYDALAEYTLTLSSVTDLEGAPVERGWAVETEGSVYTADAVATGTANADYLVDLAPTVNLGIGDSVSQSSRAVGEASNGSADSYASTDLWVGVDNASGQALVFTFDYQAVVEAAVSGPFGDIAKGRASLEVADELEVFDTLLNVFVDLPLSPLSDSDADSGRYSFTLFDGESNLIAAMIDSVGQAYAESALEPAAAPLPGSVPEPGSIALILLGLAVIAKQRRKQIKSA